MKLKKAIVLVVVAFGLVTLMSTTCSKEDSEEPTTCNGYVTGTASGNISGTYCFDALTTYNYQANDFVTLWARESSTDVGFDVKLSSQNGAALVPGTYSCASGEPGFLELIIESGNDNEFYKSQSGTLTVTQVDQTNFKATFNVVAVGYYNKQSINFSGTISK